VTPPRSPTRQPRRPFTRSPPCPPDASSVRRTPKDPGACDTRPHRRSAYPGVVQPMRMSIRGALCRSCTASCS
jgi:hypothetical protein